MQSLQIDKKTAIILSFYIFFIVDVLFILPGQVKTFVRLLSTIREIKTNITLYEEGDSKQGTIFDEKEKIKLDIIAMEGNIVTMQDISTVSAYISEKAKVNNVEILGISPSKPQNPKTTPIGKVSYLPITIEARAGFHSLARFLNTIEGGYYFLEPEEVLIQEDNPYHTVRLVLMALLKE